MEGPTLQRAGDRQWARDVALSSTRASLPWGAESAWRAGVPVDYLLFVIFPFNAFVLKQTHQSSGPCRLCLLGMVEPGIALERSVLFVYQDGQSLLSLLAPSSSGSCLKAASPPSRSALPPFPSSMGFLLWAGHAGLPGTQQSCSLWGQENFVPQQE